MTEFGTEPPRAIERPYVERVRFSWERKLEAALANVNEGGGGDDEDRWRSPVHLTESSAPRVHRVAREVAETLGYVGQFVLFQVPTLEHVNAQAFCNEDPFMVRLIGPAVSLLDDAALRAMIGHEFGHRLAHGAATSPDSRVLRLAHAHAETFAVARQACSVAAELTADRFGLLACQDLAAAVRLEVVSATLISAESLGLREYEYLADACDQVVHDKVTKVEETHPTREFRLYASWLFSRSDEYHRLTGRGPGDKTLGEVDDCLEGLLHTPSLENVLWWAAKRAPPKRVVPHDSPPPGPPAGAVPSSSEVGLIKERLIERARTFVADLAVRAQSPSKPARPREPRASEDCPIDSDPLEARFQSLERAKLDELEQRFEELERKDAEREGSK